MKSVLVLLAMFAATVAGVLWLHSPMLPLGVPGEWGWSTIPWSDAHPFAWMTNIAAAVVVLAAVAFLARRLPAAPGQSSTWRRRALMSGLTSLLAGAWWLSLLGSVPAPYGLERLPFVLYYPRMTGYYMAARHSNEDARQFLRSYQRMLGDLKGSDRYLHIGTHPPGMILLNRGFLALTAASPGLVRTLEATLPDAVRQANQTVATESAASGREFTARDAATLWLIALATLASAAACIPLLASLLRSAGHSEASALRWSALWMFVPAVAIFLPKDDVLFALPALLAGWLWLRALSQNSRSLAFAAGVVCFGGLFFSLAFLPVVLWLIIATLWAWARESRPAGAGSEVRRRASALAAGLAGFLVPVVVCMAAFEMNVPTIWRINFENHAEFYEHNERTYSKWLAANVGELMFAAGPALFVAALAGGVLRWRSRQPEMQWSCLGTAGLIVLAILWLSGKNMGEAARLWILFLPWVLLCAAPTAPRGASEEPPDSPAWLWWGAAGLQAIFCIAATLQIDGFGFSELH